MPFQNTLWQSTCESVANTCEISMRALLSCFSSFSGKLIWNMSPLVLGEMLEVFVNTLTSDDKYPVEDSENWPLSIQMQLSEKQKKFAEFFVQFLESRSNFKSFEKKMMVIANVYPKLQTVKKFVKTLSENQRFRTSFRCQHVKAPQILAKSPWEHFYHVFHHSQRS